MILPSMYMPRAKAVGEGVVSSTTMAPVAGKIDNVGISDGAAKVISPKNAVATCFDAAGAVTWFELRGPGGKMTMADDERGAVDGNVLVVGRDEIEVVQKDGAAGGFD